MWFVYVRRTCRHRRLLAAAAAAAVRSTSHIIIIIIIIITRRHRAREREDHTPAGLFGPPGKCQADEAEKNWSEK